MMMEQQTIVFNEFRPKHSNGGNDSTQINQSIGNVQIQNREKRKFIGDYSKKNPKRSLKLLLNWVSIYNSFPIWKKVSFLFSFIVIVI